MIVWNFIFLFFTTNYLLMVEIDRTCNRKNQDFAECQLFARANFYSAFNSAFFLIPHLIPHFF